MFTTKRHGFSIVEASIASVLLGSVALGIVGAMRDSSTRTANALQRQMALTIAKGQIERIRAAGPVAYSTNIDTFRVNSQGVRTPAGAFKVNIQRVISCIGGVQTKDNASVILSGFCGDSVVPMISYKVGVQYLERGLGNVGAMPVQQGVNLNLAFDQSSVLSYGACSYPQVWLGSACGCPGGGTYNAMYNTCDCPAGQSWSGTQCVATTCQASQYETRNDCAGGQVGSSTWRKDPDPSTCAYGAWTEISRTCSCPAGTTWDGSSCVAGCAAGLVWNGSACVDPATCLRVEGMGFVRNPSGFVKDTVINVGQSVTATASAVDQCPGGASRTLTFTFHFTGSAFNWTSGAMAQSASYTTSYAGWNIPGYWASANQPTGSVPTTGVDQVYVTVTDNNGYSATSSQSRLEIH